MKPSPSQLPVVASGSAPGAHILNTPVMGRVAARPQLIRPAHRSQGRRRLLWIGDAVVPTGFATVTHAMVSRLRRNWDVTVSGVNYDGSPHRHPYRIMPAWQGGDMWGMDRFAHLCAEFAPDAVVINNDWWNVARFLEHAPHGVPIIGYMPVDGRNLDPAGIEPLNKLAAAVWYTRFGHQEAVAAGYRGLRHIVPHGMDTRQFHPVERGQARRLLGLPVPENAFIVGNLNRNQPRKRLDLTLQIFAEWTRRHQVRDAWLLLHCARQDTGWDLERLARYHGIAHRLILTGGEHMREQVSEDTLRLIYSSLDVQISTTMGEGWGLTTMEGMACGIPQIVPDWAALGEWTGPALKIPCSQQLAHAEVNTIGALPDMPPFIAQLQQLHENPRLRQTLARRGLNHVRQRAFQWTTVARQLDAILQDVAVPCPDPAPALTVAR